MERSLIALDHRGRPLKEGDEILLNVNGPVFFRIVSIRPNLNPQSPADLMFVDVAATVTFTCKRESRNREFIRVQTAEEAGPLALRSLTEEEMRKLEQKQ